MSPADAIRTLLAGGLTESAIADLVGASQSTVNRVRHGRVRPNYELGAALVALAANGANGRSAQQSQSKYG